MKKIDLNSKTIFVTGAAGFIGSNLVKRLFKDVKDATIVGIDNMNDYYDVALKEYRLELLSMISDQCSVSNMQKISWYKSHLLRPPPTPPVGGGWLDL